MNFLTTKARQYPTFHLIMNAEAQDIIEERGAIRGIRYHTPDGYHEIRATLTVAADGRTSQIRQQAGMMHIEQSPPIDVLWFRLSHKASDPSDTFFHHKTGMDTFPLSWRVRERCHLAPSRTVQES